MPKCRVNFSVRMLFLILLIFWLSSEVFSSINVGPTSTLKAVGDKVVLKCVTDKKDCSDVEWTKLEGAQSPMSIYRQSTGMLNPTKFPVSRYSVNSSEGCNLAISNLELSDSGGFLCSETSGQMEYSLSAFLVVAGNFECRSNVSDPVVKEDAYGISCSVAIQSSLMGKSTIKVTWLDEKNSPIVYVSSSENTDVVRVPYEGKADPPSVPKYTCGLSLHVDSASSFDKSTSNLIACSSPSHLTHYPVTNLRFSPSGNEFQRNDAVECVADGYPRPTYRWKYIPTGDIQEKPDIIISDTSSIGDQYECTATNTINGKDYSNSSSLTVIEVKPRPVLLIIGIVIGSVLIVAVVGGVVYVVVVKKPAFGKRRSECSTTMPLNSEKAPPKPPRANSNAD